MQAREFENVFDPETGMLVFKIDKKESRLVNLPPIRMYRRYSSAGEAEGWITAAEVESFRRGGARWGICLQKSCPGMCLTVREAEDAFGQAA